MPSSFIRVSLLKPIAESFGKSLASGQASSRSSFLRLAVGQHIQFGRPVVSVRVLGAALGGAKTTTASPSGGFSLPPADLKHWKRYAKAAGNHTLGALVNCALAHAFALFPCPAGKDPLAEVTAAVCSASLCVVGKNTIAPALITLPLGSSTVFPTKAPTRRTYDIITAAQATTRESLPGFTVTTRILPGRRVEVTRIA